MGRHYHLQAPLHTNHQLPTVKPPHPPHDRPTSSKALTVHLHNCQVPMGLLEVTSESWHSQCPVWALQAVLEAHQERYLKLRGRKQEPTIISIKAPSHQTGLIYRRLPLILLTKYLLHSLDNSKPCLQDKEIHSFPLLQTLPLFLQLLRTLRPLLLDQAPRTSARPAGK